VADTSLTLPEGNLMVRDTVGSVDFAAGAGAEATPASFSVVSLALTTLMLPGKAIAFPEILGACVGGA
jgi:hypothetical protein